MSLEKLDWIWKRPFEREYQRYQDDNYWDLPGDDDPTSGLCDYFYLDGLLSDEDPEMHTWDQELIDFYLNDRERRKRQPTYVKASKLSEASWRYRSKRYLMEEDRIVELAANVILSTDPPATLEQIREAEARLNIEIPRPIRKLYMLKNGGKIKHWEAEELLPISQWIIRGPVEYSELYLAKEIPGSNLWGVDSIEEFLKENSSIERRQYWDKFICFVKAQWWRFEWGNNGTSVLQDGKYRVYHACSNAKKGCKAKMRVTSRSKAQKHKIIDRELVGEHNHPPPIKSKSSDSDSSSKESSESSDDSQNESASSSDKSTSSKLNTSWVYSDKYLSAQAVMDLLKTPEAIASVGDNMKLFAEDIKKVIETHLHLSEEQSFVQKLKVLPYLGMIFFDGEYMKSVMEIYGDIIYLDRFTFQVKSDPGSDLTLVTLMIEYNGTGIPMAFYITKAPTSESYSMFLNEVFDRFDKAPATIIVPHDELLRRSCIEKFNNTNNEANKTKLISCTTFFIEEIREKMSRSESAETDLLLETMKHLALAPSKDLFEIQLRLMNDKFSKDLPKFMRYFRDTWLTQIPPNEWAVAFQEDVPKSYNNIIESWHHRVKYVIADPAQRSICDVIDFLYIEWFYNFRLLATSN